MVNKGEKLKLDLHTHIWEASSFEKPSIDTAYKVINLLNITKFLLNIFQMK